MCGSKFCQALSLVIAYIGSMQIAHDPFYTAYNADIGCESDS